MLVAAFLVQTIVPPVMSVREIGPPTQITGGQTHEIIQGEIKATLFIPDSSSATNLEQLWIHFHTAEWFVVQEYQRANFSHPVLIFNLGQGSTTYARPFSQKCALKPFLDYTIKITERPISSLNFTSFSAGYGAVRILIQDQSILAQIRTIILCDSSYAGFSDPATRTILPEHLNVWQPVIDRAVKKELTFVMTTSEITPDSYAGTWEVASALVQKNQGEMQPANPELSASQDPSYPLLRTFAKGNWHVWSYAGTDAGAHTTHPRHLADILHQLKTK
ncbi:hypothetical protein CCB80_11630 [Armatimonadetes bacterium Uphvl-Ar1]|nr:hypothetical protein CCB80_11630 [Armatimonadetes bacterium Uphvl-Ar1]